MKYTKQIFPAYRTDCEDNSNNNSNGKKRLTPKKDYVNYYIILYQFNNFIKRITSVCNYPTAENNELRKRKENRYLMFVY